MSVLAFAVPAFTRSIATITHLVVAPAIVAALLLHASRPRASGGSTMRQSPAA